MLHTIRAAGSSSEDAVLRRMFAARKAVFVDLLGWDVPVLDGRFEVDQFDDPHATYLVVTDGCGAHLASARLLPTLRAHILGDIFPHLCEAPPPRDASVFEITRFCLDRGLDARARRRARDLLVTALVEHALAEGITGYVAIAEMAWFQQILAFGWRCRPLGLPQGDGAGLVAALRIDIDRNTPVLLAHAGMIVQPGEPAVRRAA